MSNRFAAPCYRCGENVPPKAGMFEKIGRVQRRKWLQIRGKWHVQHYECAIKFHNTDVHYIFKPKATPQ